MTVEKMHEKIDAVVEAGKIMLESGSEIYRSEETMVRMAASFGIQEIDIFTLATCIYVTCVIDGDSYTRIKRIYPKKTDLTKISQVNQLSRDMANHPISLDDLLKKLAEIEHYPKPRRIVVATAMALACGVFAFMLQNCSLNDFVCTTIISFMAYYIVDFLNRSTLHMLFKNLLVTVFMTICAIICVELGWGNKIDDIVIGGIMVVVPGVAMTNAVRDTLNGDFLSGTIRILEAITIAVGIAIGVGLVLYFYQTGWGAIV